MSEIRIDGRAISNEINKYVQNGSARGPVYGMKYQRTPGRLGRLAPKPVDIGDLTHYLISPLPTPPAQLAAPNLNYPMAGNDRYGDCTIAGVVHTDQATANLTHEDWTYPGDKVVEDEYFDLTGGEDTGLVETDVLKVWQSNSGLFGHRLDAFAPINVKHTQTIKQGVLLCGAVYTGVLIPAPAQGQFANHQPWDLTGTSQDDDIEGGHAVPIVGYNATGPIVVTWAALQQVTWRWWNQYAEEAYATITAEVKARGNLRNVAVKAIEEDLKQL